MPQVARSACGRRRDCRRSTDAAAPSSRPPPRRRPPPEGRSPTPTLTWAVRREASGSQAATSRHRQRAGVPRPRAMRAELAGDVAAVSTPASTQLPATSGRLRAVRKEFAPSAAEVASVKSWLTSAGLSVTKTDAKYPAGAYVGVRGSVAAAAKAFGVTFGTYRGPGGQSDRAPEPRGHRAPRLSPARSPRSPAWTPRRARSSLPAEARARTTGSPSRAPTYYGAEDRDQQAQGVRQAPALERVCGYTPGQVRGAYGVTASGMTGKGQTVAVVDAYASPTMHDGRQPVRDRAIGDPQFAAGRVQAVPGGPLHPGEQARISVTRRAGSARRPWTSNRRTAWPRRPRPVRRRG